MLVTTTNNIEGKKLQFFAVGMGPVDQKMLEGLKELTPNNEHLGLYGVRNKLVKNDFFKSHVGERVNAWIS